MEPQSAYDQQRVMVITDIFELLSVMLKEKEVRVVRMNEMIERKTDIRDVCLFTVILLCDDANDLIQAYNQLNEKEDQILSLPAMYHVLTLLFQSTVYIQ